MHRIFSGNGGLAVLSIRKAAPHHRPIWLPVQEPLALLILFILCIHVHKNKSYPFPGAVAFRSKWRRRPGCASLWCGRDARAPGWASSHDRVSPWEQNCRSLPVPGVVGGGLSVFVFIRVHSWFVFIEGHLFPTRMIRPFVRGRGRDLAETTEKSVIHEGPRKRWGGEG